ncbi:MAG: hypothetical protein OXI96_10865 [Acidimicrobiaceae bacterium]|nr:hypothetical protein [Acidimicrobiaceae bacterium]
MFHVVGCLWGFWGAGVPVFDRGAVLKLMMLAAAGEGETCSDMWFVLKNKQRAAAG